MTSVNETVAQATLIKGGGSSSVAHDATVLAPPSGPVETRGAGFATTLDRTTVLPKVADAGGVPTLAYEQALRYEQIGELGAGGVGEVVKVQDNDIGRLVALKRLRPELNNAHALARFVEEIRVVGKLEHPNIVPIHDVGVDAEGRHYFVMKYVQGETLESIIEKLANGDAEYHRRYPFERRVQIFQGVLDAIAFAHSQGVIHRDIKPANVMVGHYGEVMMMDWGIAKRVGAKETIAAAGADKPSASALQTQLGALVGTPAYMSPEQARGQLDLDERSDVYALCVLFWELLTLQHPLAHMKTLDEVIHGVVHEDVPHAAVISKPNPHQPPVPADLAWFVHAGLSKDREKRFPSVRAMMDRLERRAEGDFPIQCPITATMRVSSIVRRSAARHPMATMVLWSIFALAFIAAIVLAIVR